MTSLVLSLWITVWLFLVLANSHEMPIWGSGIHRLVRVRPVTAAAKNKKSSLSSSAATRTLPDHRSLMNQHSTRLQHVATQVFHTGHERMHVLWTRLTAGAVGIASSPSFPHYIAGITAGALECIVGHPLDTIRVRIITAGSGGGSGAASTLGQFRHAFVQEGGVVQGIRSLYRGCKSELLSAAVAGALLFGVNDFFKRWARGELQPSSRVVGRVSGLSVDQNSGSRSSSGSSRSSSRGSSSSSSSSSGTAKSSSSSSSSIGGGHNDEDERVTGPLLIAAAGTGLMDGIISKPLEMLKLRQQILPAGRSAPLSLAPLALGGMAASGASGLSGMSGAAGAELVGVSGLGAVGSVGVGVGPLGHLSALGAALTQGWSNHHPATVASATSASLDLSFSQSLRLLVREEGIGSLFRGWLPTVLRESLGNAAFFAAYHYTKNAVTRWEWERKQQSARRKMSSKDQDQSHPTTSTDSQRSQGPHVSTTSPTPPPSIPSPTAPLAAKDSTGAILLAGAMAGLAYTLCSHPLEIASILMQSDVPRKRVLMVPLAGAKAAAAGVGVGVGVGRGSVRVGSHAMRTVLEYRYDRGMLDCLRSVYNTAGSAAAGALGTVTAAGAAATASASAAAGAGAGTALGTSVGGGIGALYRGAYPSILRALPSYAASFWGYEKTLELIERLKRDANQRGGGVVKGVQGKGVGRNKGGAERSQ